MRSLAAVLITTAILSAPSLSALAGDGKKAPAPAACTSGETRCEGAYTGKVKQGNNPPAGARVMVCKGGKWKIQKACNGAKNMGCYLIDEPAAAGAVARCASALASGE